MKIEKIIDYFSSATTGDLLFTLAIIVIAIAVIGEIFYIGSYLKKLHTVIKREMEITNKHLAHIDHNPYNYNYDKSKQNNNNNDDENTRL